VTSTRRLSRRTFVGGALLAAGAAAAWVRGARLAPGGGGRPGGLATCLPDGRTLVRDAALAFGTTVTVAAVHADPAAAAAGARDALAATRRVDALMTVYRAGSEVGRLNADGVLERPDPHLVRVLGFAQRLADLSGGAFDVTVQPLWVLYAACKREGRLPAPAEVARARARVDWTAVELSPRRITLGRRGMSVTLNGIAQGYAADLALAALRRHGVRDALVDTGEYGADGARQPGEPWTIGIQHPRDPGAVLAAVALDGRFVATSGDYETAFSEDLLYHHVFDPHTGRSPPGLSAVTVAAPTGMEADALTKPMMVLDLAGARALLARFPGAGALWIDKEAHVVASQDLPLVSG
jgi:thiamine biosynthesis lipoprotein